MRQNALLRSDKGLGIPSTARKKDRLPRSVAPSCRADDRHDHFAVRNGVRCAGVHLIVDLHGAEGPQRHRPDRGDAAPLRRRRGRDAAAHPSAPFPAEAACPAWRCWRRATSRSTRGRRAGYAALDIFMCGKADPDACIPVLREAFKAKRVEVDEILRGQGDLTLRQPGLVRGIRRRPVDCDCGPGRLP